MVSVFIAGSRRFWKEIEELKKSLEESGIACFTAGKSRDGSNEAEAMANALRLIESSDVFYLYSGIEKCHIGLSSSLELGFALASGKPVLSSCIPDDPGISFAISSVVAPDMLADWIKTNL